MYTKLKKKLISNNMNAITPSNSFIKNTKKYFLPNKQCLKKSMKLGSKYN